MIKTTAQEQSMAHEPTGDLLERHRSGDVRAFTALVERFQGPLLRHARGVLGPGSPYEDVVQEALMKLAQAPPELPSGAQMGPEAQHGHLAAWLHTVTRNLCMDLARSETRRRRREQNVASKEATCGGLAAVEASDTQAAVEARIDGLPQSQREVLVLRLFGDKSYREIAEITGKKVGTVGWLVSVGLKALSLELAPLVRGDA